ncbi:hypothetical protein SmJEL517_g06064 [Synchytrium microbalum]|uniref:DUF1294 domain-containing protein n=1 Tax=Synchytrium microbalum TaxID=1806994 RepID=A0A507BYM6_9FUNG|nr:uncharacterized protein SmJEL517_g06064 [Synchytrium microbalum]TPX30373.1 hypothetical protein SmJEL517_g06064 [Synchytrium microbalum]
MNGLRFFTRLYSNGPARRPNRRTKQPAEPPFQQQFQQQPQTSSPASTALLYMVGGYLAVINAASFGLFWYDKEMARAKKWRVPEKTLQLSALAGGWIGGMFAMTTFKHKTVKTEFRIPYFICTGLNMIMLTGLAYTYRRHPALLKYLGHL